MVFSLGSVYGVEGWELNTVCSFGTLPGTGSMWEMTNEP